MVKRKGGTRARSRQLMRKSRATRGKISLTQFFMTYATGDKVTLIAEPAYHKGMFPLRFFGKNAIVAGQRGTCYLVTIRDGNKIKTLITHPIHMRKMANSVEGHVEAPTKTAAPKVTKVEAPAHKPAAAHPKVAAKATPSAKPMAKAVAK